MARLVIEITVAVLAVFGLYALVRWGLVRFLLPAVPSAAIEIGRPMAEEEVALLLTHARESFFLRGSGRVIALVDRSLRKDATLIATLLNGGAVIHFVKLLGEEG